MFFRGQVIYRLYTDDTILAALTQKAIDDTITNLKKTKLCITVEGTLSDFLGVKIDRKSNGRIELSQEHLIEQILKDIHVSKAKPAETPAMHYSILKRFLRAPEL